MKAIKKSLFGKVVAVCVMSLFLTAANVSPVLAEIQVRHKAIGFFVPEKRIRLEARVIKDDSEIKLVRCYFRATEQADYVFVGMEPSKQGAYTAILPAPSKETMTIQYLFLIVNQNNQPIKTQVYTVSKKDSNTVPSWQQVSSEGTIQVSTEVGNAQASVAGFSDSITMDVVESSARFGVVTGGIYTASATSAAGTGAIASGTVSTATGAATTGAAATGAGTAGAVAGGTVATGTAATAGTAAAAGIGLSTGAMVGIGVGAAALVGGAAVAANNSSGSDTETPPPTPDTVSTWEFHSRCANSSVESPVVFNIQLNETKGGAFNGSGSGQRADYEGGIPITMSIDSGSYDAKSRVLSGRVTTTTTKLPLSCQRIDNFSFSIPSNDTGYQNVVEQGNTCGTESGCVMQVRFIKK